MNEKYVEFCALFERAEKRIGMIERIEATAAIPAINELRYAACHIKRSFQAPDATKELEEITSATRHCKRAIYDCAAIHIDFTYCWLEEFVKGFKFVTISSVVKDHLEYCKKLNDAITFLENHNHDSAEEVSEQMEQQMDGLQEIFAVYKAARDDLNTKARCHNLTVVLAVLTILATVIGITISAACN